jgi:hypothetical protein
MKLGPNGIVSFFDLTGRFFAGGWVGFEYRILRRRRIRYSLFQSLFLDLTGRFSGQRRH